MRKLNIYLAASAIFLTLTIQSCSKQLDQPSRNSLDASIALTNKSGIEASLNSVYAVLKSLRLYGRDLFAVPAAMSDIAYANGRSSRLLGENRNQSLSNMANWATSYGAINEINLTLDAINNVGDPAGSK